MTWNHLVSFFNVLWLSAYRSLITLDKFIPWYFWCNFKQDFYFLLTFYDLSLLVYRNSIDFFILIRYSAALLSLFISSNVVMWSLLGFLYRVSCHLHIVTILPLPMQFEYIFFFFFSPDYCDFILSYRSYIFLFFKIFLSVCSSDWVVSIISKHCKKQIKFKIYV